MTEEQKHLQKVAWNCVSALRAWQDCFGSDNDIHKMIGTCIKTFRQMIKEWEYAIGHPSAISNETLAEITEKMAPIIVETIRRRGPENF